MRTLKLLLVLALLLVGAVATALPSMAASHSPMYPASFSIQDDIPTPTPTPVSPNAPVDCGTGGC